MQENLTSCAFYKATNPHILVHPKVVHIHVKTWTWQMFSPLLHWMKGSQKPMTNNIPTAINWTTAQRQQEQKQYCIRTSQ